MYFRHSRAWPLPFLGRWFFRLCWQISQRMFGYWLHNSFRLNRYSRQLPAIPIEPERIVKPVAKHTLTDLPAETKEPSTEKRQRPGARMTKVHLQAVSKSEKKPVKTSQPEESKTVTNEAVERLPKQHMPAEQVFALARLKPDTSPE